MNIMALGIIFCVTSIFLLCYKTFSGVLEILYLQRKMMYIFDKIEYTLDNIQESFVGCRPGMIELQEQLNEIRAILNESRNSNKTKQVQAEIVSDSNMGSDRE